MQIRKPKLTWTQEAQNYHISIKHPTTVQLQEMKPDVETNTDFVWTKGELGVEDIQNMEKTSQPLLWVKYRKKTKSTWRPAGLAPCGTGKALSVGCVCACNVISVIRRLGDSWHFRQQVWTCVLLLNLQTKLAELCGYKSTKTHNVTIKNTTLS